MSTVAALCSVGLAALVLLLSWHVSRGRQSTGAGAGSSVDPTDALYKRVRAHANAAEHVPVLIALILLVGARQPPRWMEGVMVAVVAGRLAHAAGMLVSPTLARSHPLRFWGQTATIGGGLVLAGCAAVRWLSP